MSAAPKRQLTEAEYLAIEERAEFKSEFLGGEMFAMAGGSYDHDAIIVNLIREFSSRLKGSRCRVHSSDLQLRVDETGLYTYPDMFIICGAPAFVAESRRIVTNARVVFEVLSPGTADYDRVGKFRHYAAIPTLQEYVLVASDEVRIERHVRQPGGTWASATFADPVGSFALASVPAEVPMIDIYADLGFLADALWESSLRGHEIATPKRKLTPADYLVYERPSEFRSELIDGFMAPLVADIDHGRIKTRLILQVPLQLRGSPYRCTTSSQRVSDGRGNFFYPDMVFFEHLVMDEIDDHSLTTPHAILEIASAESGAFVRGPKFDRYRHIPSLREYVVVDQDAVRVEQHVRRDDGAWDFRTHADPAGEVRLASVHAVLSLAELYAA